MAHHKISKKRLLLKNSKGRIKYKIKMNKKAKQKNEPLKKVTDKL